jgi:hypothetical protein
MIHTTLEIFSGYMLLFWLLQNFYMSIAMQSCKRIYTLSYLIYMYGLNGLLIVLAYAWGSFMLLGYSLQVVLYMTVFFVCSVEYMFWCAGGYARELFAITIAQLCSAASIIMVHAVATYFS